MGLMDKLNNLTQQLNNVADKLTNNAGMQQNMSCEQPLSNPGGLSGLGNIYSTHENGVMESPVIPSAQQFTDNRKITTYTDKFNDNYQYVEYFRNWFVETGLFNVSANGDCIVLQMGTTVNNQPFVANYNVFACITQADVDAVLKQIETAGVNNGTTVIIGYLNFNINHESIAKHFGAQLIGIEGIQEINSAIDLADSKMPYITFDKTSFLHILSTALHTKYKAQQPGSTGNTFNDMTQSINTSLNNIGEQTSQAVAQFIEATNVTDTTQNNIHVNNEAVDNTPVAVEVPQMVKDDDQLAMELANGVSLDKSSGVHLGKEVVTQEVLTETPVQKSGVSLGKKSGVSLGK